MAAEAIKQPLQRRLECKAVAHAAQRATQAQIQSLKRSIAQQRRVVAADQIGFFNLDEAMNNLILTIAAIPPCGN